MNALRAVAAYKYGSLAELQAAPNGLARLAVVEVTEGTAIPAPLVHWDVTYVAPGAAPADRALYAAKAYTWGDAIPAWLRAVATWVVATIISVSGHGHLDFSAAHAVDSHHVVTLGL